MWVPKSKEIPEKEVVDKMQNEKTSHTLIPKSQENPMLQKTHVVPLSPRAEKTPNEEVEWRQKKI